MGNASLLSRERLHCLTFLSRHLQLYILVIADGGDSDSGAKGGKDAVVRGIDSID